MFRWKLDPVTFKDLKFLSRVSALGHKPFAPLTHVLVRHAIKNEDVYFVMWWVPAGHKPSVEEAVVRLEHLKLYGPSDHAFDWKTAGAQLWKTAHCAPAGQVA